MTDLIKRLLVLEGRLEYLNGYKAGVEGESLPVDAGPEYVRGATDGWEVRAGFEARERKLDLHLLGLREGLTGADVSDTPTCAELDAGRDEGMDLREKILASASAPSVLSKPPETLPETSAVPSDASRCWTCGQLIWMDQASGLAMGADGPHTCGRGVGAASIPYPLSDQEIVFVRRLYEKHCGGGK